MRAPHDLRNVLAHQYFRVNEQLVWRAVADDIPVLSRAVEAALRDA